MMPTGTLTAVKFFDGPLAGTKSMEEDCYNNKVVYISQLIPSSATRYYRIQDQFTPMVRQESAYVIKEIKAGKIVHWLAFEIKE